MKKDVEIILREMIELVYKEGREPVEIKIESSLYNKLRKKFKKIGKDKYEIIDEGVLYHPDEEPTTIETFMGIPVRESFETMVRWKADAAK